MTGLDGELLEFALLPLPPRPRLPDREAGRAEQAALLRRVFGECDPAYHDLLVMRFNEQRAARLEAHLWGAEEGEPRVT